MPVYERHVFVCTRGEWCPSVDGDGLGVHAALKSAVRATDLAGRVRINHSGCFSQCGNGPMMVVYPDGVWYAAVTPADVAEIVESHLEACGAPALRPPGGRLAPARADPRRPTDRPCGAVARAERGRTAGQVLISSG